MAGDRSGGHPSSLHYLTCIHGDTAGRHNNTYLRHISTVSSIYTSLFHCITCGLKLSTKYRAIFTTRREHLKPNVSTIQWWLLPAYLRPHLSLVHSKQTHNGILRQQQNGHKAQPWTWTNQPRQLQLKIGKTTIFNFTWGLYCLKIFISRFQLI